jgi:hypothetical protein
MLHVIGPRDGIPEGLSGESSVVLSTTVQHECASYNSKISKMMILLNSGHTNRVPGIYSDIVDTCTKSGCRNHLRDLHLQVSDYFDKNNQPLHRLAAYTLGYYFSQAAKNSPEALGIEQNEYAISSREPIGTASVGECICICLKNLSSNEIFVAHVDRRTDKESINQVIKDFLKDSKAEGYLIGGSVENSDLLEISEQNLSKMKEILSNYGEKIKIEEKTLATPHSTAFVYDCDGKLHENVYPGKLSLERMARNGIAAKAGMRHISKFESRSSSPFTPLEITREQAIFAGEEIACLENEQNRRTSPVYQLELESVLLYADNRPESPKKISAIDQLLQGNLFSEEFKDLTFLQGRLEGVQIDDLAPVLSPDQALGFFLEDQRGQAIQDKQKLLREANRFLEDNPNVEKGSFLAKLENYWKFREPAQEEAVQGGAVQE